MRMHHSGLYSWRRVVVGWTILGVVGGTACGRKDDKPLLRATNTPPAPEKHAASQALSAPNVPASHSPIDRAGSADAGAALSARVRFEHTPVPLESPVRHGKPRFSFAGSLPEQSRYFTKVCCSPDGTHFITVSMQTETGANLVALWDSQTRSAVKRFDWDFKVIRDPKTTRIVQRIQGHTSGITDLAYSPDGHYIATGSYDNTTRIWDARNGRDLQTLNGHTNAIDCIAYSPDGKSILTASQDNTARIWNPQTGRTVTTFHKLLAKPPDQYDFINAVAYAPDGKHVAITDGNTVKLWEVKTARVVQTLRGHSEPVRSVAYSPDGKHIATGGEDSSAKIWDIRSGHLIRSVTGDGGMVRSVAYSPDGKYLVLGFEETAKIWDAKTGSIVQTLEGSWAALGYVAYSPGGQYIVTGRNESVKIWKNAP